MFKFPQLLAGLLAANLVQAAELTWRWSNPVPHGTHILGMAAAPGWFVQVGHRGEVYVSRDLDRWTPKETSTSKSLRSVAFFGNQLVVVGEEGTILRAASPEPSDPFQKIDLGTSAWLEGLAVSPGLLVAVGDDGAVYTSANALDWELRPQPFNAWFRSVAYGAERFVAVGEDGFIATSLDGTLWQPAQSGTTTHLNHVSWIANEFVAVGDQGRVLVSANGLQWQQAGSGASGTLNTAAGFPGTLLVAGQSEVRLRVNGIWSDQTQLPGAFPAPAWTYLSSLWNGDLFLLGGRSGKTIEGFQTAPGSNYAWVDRFESLRHWIWDLTRTPEFYLAVGDRATILTSHDGIEWDLEFVPPSAAETIFLGAGGSSNLFLAVGSGGRGVSSTNGVIWEPVSFPTTQDLQGVAYGHNLFVVTGGNGIILTSPDGRTWTPRNSGVTTFLSSVAAHPSGFVAVGSGGTILASPDGISWTPRPSSTIGWIYRVRHLNGRLLAVGENGILLSSENGQNWTLHPTGTTRWLNDVVHAGGAFYIAGVQGTLLSSADGVAWSEARSPAVQSLFALAAHQGQLLVAGVEGAILRARVEPFPSPVSIHTFRRHRGRNLFLFTGAPDQRFLLESSSDLRNWSFRAQLELAHGENSLLYLEPHPEESPRRFFRVRSWP